MAQRKYILPVMVTGPADVAHLILEMEALEEYLTSASLRKKNDAKLPKMSRTLEVFAESNDADLLRDEDRHHLAALLESVQQHAPVLHVSFAADPSAEFTAKIVTWFRNNVSQYALVQVGLQPSIAAGCVVRTTNKVFDLSLRRYLQKNRGLLLKTMESFGSNATPSAQPAVAAVAAAPATAVAQKQRPA